MTHQIIGSKWFNPMAQVKMLSNTIQIEIWIFFFVNMKETKIIIKKNILNFTNFFQKEKKKEDKFCNVGRVGLYPILISPVGLYPIFI